MKISKKLLSLLICLAMLITMMPTVLANTPAISVVAKDEAVNLTLSADAFNADGSATEKVTLTDAVTEEVESGNYALHMSNTTSKYQRAFASPYADVSGGQFSISYDICVNSFTPPASNSANFFVIGGKNDPIISGKSQWMISLKPFRASAGISDYIVFSDTDIRLYNNNWYHVIHYFDSYSGMRTDYVIDSEGNVRSRMVAEGFGIKDIQYFTITSEKSPAGNYYLDNITLKDESVKISSMPETIEASEQLSFNVTLPDSFESALVLADGDVIDNIAPVAGKNSYDVTIPAGILAVGNREIMVSASYANEMSRSTSTKINVCKESILGITNKNGEKISTETETFDALISKATYSTVNNWYWIKYDVAQQNTAWQTNCTSYLIPGASGEANDYGLQIKETANLIKIYNLGTYAAATNGKLILNFDILLTAESTNVQISDTMAIAAGQTNFINANKLMGKIAISPNVWTNVNMEYNFDDEAWYITANNETVTYNSGTTKAFTECSFTLRSTSATFAMDNARVYNLVEDATVTSAAYDSTAITNKAIPASATTLNLTLSDAALAPTIDDVELYVDGTQVNATAVSTTDGVVSITLPALTANTDLNVVIKNTVSGLGNDITETFYVTDANGYFFKSAGIVKSGAKLIGTVRHFGNTGFTPVVASYNANELTSVATDTYRYDNTNQHHANLSGHSAYNMVLTPSSADSAKVMAWNSLTSATPKITSPLYNVD